MQPWAKPGCPEPGRYHPHLPERTSAGKPAAMDPKLLELLVCPVTKGPLTYNRETQELVSRSARLAYPVRDGIPVMLEDEARKLASDDPLLEE